ncbi:radical SAM protein [Chloroflexota bacterium]
MVKGCCLNCVFCWSEIGLSDDQDESFYSPEEVFTQLSKVAERFGTAKVRLSGGEPTLGQQHLLALLSLIEKSRFKIFILETNGLCFGLDSDYVKQISRFKKVHVRLSLKAGTEEAFVAKTGIEPQAFYLPFTAIENLIKYGCRFNVSAITDPRVMCSTERQSLLSLLNSIDPNLIKDLEEEYIEPYRNSLLRLRNSYPLKWPFPIVAAVDLPIRY